MGLVRRFQQAPDVRLRTVPRRPARRGIVFKMFSRRRVGLRGAQETIGSGRSYYLKTHKKELRNTLASAIPRKPIFFGLPGTASSRQRLFCGRASRPQAPHPSEVRPFEPWC